MVKTHNNNIAVLSNNVCKSSYNLTVSEHRVIKMFLNSITDYYGTDISSSHTLTIQEYVEQWGIVASDARKELQDAVLTLWRKELYNVTNSGTYSYTRWCDSFTYSREQDTLTIKWSDTILSHISLLKERFTKLDLLEIKDFSSSYSFRLYEILICAIGENSFKNPKFEVEVLMDMMQVPESYRNYRTFKARVLTPCTSELQNKTNKFSKLSLIEHKRKGSKKIMEVEFSGVGIGKKYKNLC